jgi:hypothetical protein
VLTDALIALASAGGAGLVQAVSTDVWMVAKAGVVRLLGRGDPEREGAVERQLERTRSEVRAAGPSGEQVRSRHESAWTTRLEDLLAEHPDQADQLRSLLSTITAAGASIGHVDQRVVGFDHAQQAIQGHGTQMITFGSVGSSSRSED